MTEQGLSPVRLAVRNLRVFLDNKQVIEQVSRALPAKLGLTAERMIRQVITLVQVNPELLECSHTSILAGLIQASQLGLELSGVLGQAYLVPRWDKRRQCKEAVFQTGYRGLINLAYRSNRVLLFTAREVYARDHFRAVYGSNALLEHVPDLGAEPGLPTAYYALVKLRGGECDFEVMSRSRVEQHAARFATTTAIWQNHFDEMAKKTCCRRLAKHCPISVDYQSASILDEYGEAGVGQGVPEQRPSRSEQVGAELLEAFPQDGPPPGEGEVEVAPGDGGEVPGSG